MATEYDVREFGAVGDGKTNDAMAIQAAIDACAAAGGGRVLVPSGAVYRAGSIVLKSNVDLHVERGATLQASGDWDDITERLTVSALSSGVVHDKTLESGLFIAAYRADNVAVSGTGTIDGSGRCYVLEDLGPIYRMPVTRPFTLFFIDCTDVSITESLYYDGALWTVRLTGCERVLIHGIRIDGDMKLPNNDGIDLDRCRDVRVSDCFIKCGDDALSLKACEEFPDSGPCENITVTNCVLETKSSALVIGVDASTTIRNVVFDNCVIKSSHRGLSVNMGQDSHYENILFSNMVIETRLFDDSWWGRGEPIYVSAKPWHDEVGTVKNLRFVNILARSENGVFIEGHVPGLIDDVLLENVRIELDSWSEFIGGQHDHRPYPNGDEIVQHGTSGFFIDTASNVTVRNCQVAWGANKPDYFTHALEFLDAPGLVVEGFRGEAAHEGAAAVRGDREIASS